MYQHVKQLGDNNRDCYFLYKGLILMEVSALEDDAIVFVIGKKPAI